MYKLFFQCLRFIATASLKPLTKEKTTIGLGKVTLNQWHISHFSYNSFTKSLHLSFHILVSTKKASTI